MKIETLSVQHPYKIERSGAVNAIKLLYAGGYMLEANAESILFKRPRELQEIYAARLRSIVYLNPLATGLGWYVAAMFGTEPRVKVSADKFWEAFLQDSTRTQVTFAECLSLLLTSMLLYERSWWLIDLPKLDPTKVKSRADERALGADRPYLVEIDTQSVLDWQEATDGTLEWVVIASCDRRRQKLGAVETVYQWRIYDREKFELYESDKDKRGEAKLVDSGPHAMTPLKRVPVRYFSVPEALWLANRVYIPARTHLNLHNSMHWGMNQACLPQLIVAGDLREGTVERSETAFIQTDPDTKLSYLEPSGTSFKCASDELSSLREEIYRLMHLSAQGRSTDATASAQSGYSKEMDMAPSGDILGALARIVTRAGKELLRDVIAVRGESIEPELSGLEPSDADGAEQEIEDTGAVQKLGVRAPTFERWLKKALVRKLMLTGGATDELISAAEAEIDASPTDEEARIAEEDRQAKRIGSGMDSAVLNRARLWLAGRLYLFALARVLPIGFSIRFHDGGPGTPFVQHTRVK